MTHSSYAPCVPPCGVISLHRPWWRRWWAAWRERGRRRVTPEAIDPSGWTERDLLSLRGLSEDTLRDIGAPEWVRQSHEERRRALLDGLRL